MTENNNSAAHQGFFRRIWNWFWTPSGVLSVGFTLIVGFLAPLIIYLVKKDESEYVKEHAKESLNFQISITVYILACIPLMIIIIGIFLAIIIGVASLVLVILATIRASEGRMYRYPYIFRLIK